MQIQGGCRWQVQGLWERQGFPLQNAFKQSEREPDPREGIGTAEDTRGVPRGAQSWRDGGGEMGDSRARRERTQES